MFTSRAMILPPLINAAKSRPCGRNSVPQRCLVSAYNLHSFPGTPGCGVLQQYREFGTVKQRRCGATWTHQSIWSVDKVCFNDERVAFGDKTWQQLLRMIFVLRACRIKTLVRESAKLLSAAQTVLGQRLVDRLLKATFFGHFCGGESLAEVQSTIAELQKKGVGAILDYASEKDIENHKCGALEGDAAYDRVTSQYITAIQVASDQPIGFAAIKLTSLTNADVLKRASMLVNEAALWFAECSGVSQRSSLPNPNFPMAELPVSSIRGAGVSLTAFHDFCTSKWGSGNWEELFDEMLALQSSRTMSPVVPKGRVDWYTWQSFFKPNEIGHRRMAQMTPLENAHGGSVPILTIEEQGLWDSFIARLERVADAAASTKGVRVLVDAECAFVQPAIDWAALEFQGKYNQLKTEEEEGETSRATVYNTYQAYLIGTVERVDRDIARAKALGLSLGVKLVRGAYLSSEARLAAEHGYKNPVLPTIEDTHYSYNESTRHLLKAIVDGRKDGIELLCGTHNETSVLSALAECQRLDLDYKTIMLSFGQLLGMCDRITFALGHHGVRAFKYVPYGPVEEVIPYLLRRAEENSAMLGGAVRELQVAGRELRRRLKFQ